MAGEITYQQPIWLLSTRHPLLPVPSSFNRREWGDRSVARTAAQLRAARRPSIRAPAHQRRLASARIRTLLIGWYPTDTWRSRARSEPRRPLLPSALTSSL